MPIITIGMPVYNCERTLSHSIQSILNQDFHDWELLVIDDGSTDSSAAVAESFRDARIHVLRRTDNRGLPTRLNEAVALAKGKYFARMDGDDICYPDRLRKQVDFLDRHPEVDVLGAGMVVFGSGGRLLGCRIGPEDHASICARPWAGLHMAHPTWMGRIEWFRAHPYREDAVRMEDKELLFRTFRSSRFANLPDILLGYREESLSLSKILPSRKNYCRVLLEDGLRSRRYVSMLAGIASQCVRAVMDVVAVSTGLNHKLLRQRARPCTSAVAREWGEVFQRVTRSSGN